MNHPRRSLSTNVSAPKPPNNTTSPLFRQKIKVIKYLETFKCILNSFARQNVCGHINVGRCLIRQGLTATLNGVTSSGCKQYTAYSSITCCFKIYYYKNKILSKDLLLH